MQPSFPLHLLHCFSSLRFGFKQSFLRKTFTKPQTPFLEQGAPLFQSRVEVIIHFAVSGSPVSANGTAIPVPMFRLQKWEASLVLLCLPLQLMLTHRNACLLRFQTVHQTRPLRLLHRPSSLDSSRASSLAPQLLFPPLGMSFSIRKRPK